MNFDPGNLIINGYSASESVRALAPYVLHVHATDGVRDLGRGRGLDVPLGRGSADYPDLLSILEEQRFQGFITVERDSASNPLLEISQAVEYLRRL